MIPILYTQRDNPYAIRARLALVYAGIRYEAREVSPGQIPEELLSLSREASIPSLQLGPKELLGDIRALLTPGGIFVSKTPCVGDMNPLVHLAIPLMRLVGKAPSRVTSLTAGSLEEAIRSAGFEIVANERHGSEKKDTRPFITARARD